MKIAVLNIATGNYISLFQKSKDCISKNFLTNHDVDIFLFTDSDLKFTDERVGIKKYHIERKGFPGDTLYRYDYFLLAEEELKNYDYIYYLDVDCNVVAPVGEEVFGDLVATFHPGFYKPHLHMNEIHLNTGEFENRPESTAYVSREDNMGYFCGGFQGGIPEKYIKAWRTISYNIEVDADNGIVARWHDESHWNAYLRQENPTLKLTPEYCYAEENYPWLNSFKDTKKIMAMLKDDKKLREA
jgi:histo-blood group ABO system transferase|tara:strand:- start:51 stop:779 length:729 start_codon:yes stop_codon:yes gene_type:complete